MDHLMPIGEFAERSGLSPKRLRTYAAAGVLLPAAIDPESGYRYYAPGQLREAQAIDALRRADVPLAEVARLLRDPSPERLDAWSRQVDLDKDERQDALRSARRLLALSEEAAPDNPVNEARQERQMRMTAVARTDVGRVREQNEDSAVGAEGLLAVADGMGGLPRGEIASSLAIAIVESAFDGRSIIELEAAAKAANCAVFERASADEQLDGMGTTLCAVGLTHEGQLAVVNVGDSRAYLLRNGALQRLTTDHTLVAELVRQGELTEDDIADHPQRSVLTRAVGAAPTVELDATVHPAEPGDRLLLCTDGLTNEIDDRSIQSVIESQPDLNGAAGALVDRAVASGGRDNVTVVIADISA